MEWVWFVVETLNQLWIEKFCGHGIQSVLFDVLRKTILSKSPQNFQHGWVCGWRICAYFFAAEGSSLLS